MCVVNIAISSKFAFIAEECIQEYLKVFDVPDAPKALVVTAGRRCVKRQEFRGTCIINKDHVRTLTLNTIHPHYGLIGSLKINYLQFNDVLVVPSASS